MKSIILFQTIDYELKIAVAILHNIKFPIADTPIIYSAPHTSGYGHCHFGGIFISPEFTFLLTFADDLFYNGIQRSVYFI
jgi:hypothetical protein